MNEIKHMPYQGQKFNNYLEACKFLGQKSTSGKSRQIQLANWSKYFAYHKQGHSIIIDEIISEPVIDGRTNNSGGNNHKNLDIYYPYIKAMLWESAIDETQYCSMSYMYCDMLHLLKKNVIQATYQKFELLKKYCTENNITEVSLFQEYVHSAERYLKSWIMKTLKKMQNEGLIRYEGGYTFIMKRSEHSRFKAYISTSEYNNQVLKIEEDNCEVFSDMSEKMKGRQLLFLIYKSPLRRREFKKWCVNALNNDNKILAGLRELMDDKYDHHPEVNPNEFNIFDYYYGIKINFLTDKIETESSGTENIMNLLREKLKRNMKKSFFYNERDFSIIQNLVLPKKLPSQEEYEEKMAEEYMEFETEMEEIYAGI